MGKLLGAVLEDANEGDLMFRSTIGLARKFRREKYMVDDEDERGLVKAVQTWNVESRSGVIFGGWKRAPQAPHAATKVGGGEGTMKRICCGEVFLKSSRSLPCHEGHTRGPLKHKNRVAGSHQPSANT